MGFSGVLPVGVRASVGLKLLFVTGCGLAFERFIYGAPLGWLAALSVATLMIGAVIFSGVARLSPLVLGGSGIVALLIEPHWASVLLAFVGLISVTLTNQAEVVRDAWRWMRAIAAFVVRMPSEIASAFSFAPDPNVTQNIRRYLGGFAGRWILPLSFGSAFAFLFLIGNPLIADRIGSLMAWFGREGDFSLRDLSVSGLRVLLVALLCWPFLHSRDLTLVEGEDKGLREWVSPGSALRTVLLCNLIFGLQNFLDLTVLWGDAGLPEEMTLSDYAHQGIHPLAFATVLVAVFVLLALPAGGSAEKTRGIRWLTFIWIGQTFLLTASCLKRLEMYISAYSLTYIRVFAILIVLSIGMGLLWILLRIIMQWSNRWLFTASTLTALVFLFVGSVTDIGARIAWFNVEHSREVGGSGVHLDVRYLRDAIGPSAVPALAWFVENRTQKIEKTRWVRTDDEAAAVQAALTRDFAARMKDPRAWTLRRYLLQQKIARLK